MFKIKFKAYLVHEIDAMTLYIHIFTIKLESAANLRCATHGMWFGQSYVARVAGSAPPSTRLVHPPQADSAGRSFLK